MPTRAPISKPSTEQHQETPGKCHQARGPHRCLRPPHVHHGQPGTEEGARIDVQSLEGRRHSGHFHFGSDLSERCCGDDVHHRGRSALSPISQKTHGDLIEPNRHTRVKRQPWVRDCRRQLCYIPTVWPEPLQSDHSPHKHNSHGEGHRGIAGVLVKGVRRLHGGRATEQRGLQKTVHQPTRKGTCKHGQGTSHPRRQLGGHQGGSGPAEEHADSQNGTPQHDTAVGECLLVVPSGGCEVLLVDEGHGRLEEKGGAHSRQEQLHDDHRLEQHLLPHRLRVQNAGAREGVTLQSSEAN
mmetsp:Transcript_29066/g.56948  ORF Transcript_29066/g.56948 Transcript_29066/m.56948 type:complete len:297 (+) Transcript_29066:101-991(+)